MAKMMQIRSAKGFSVTGYTAFRRCESQRIGRRDCGVDGVVHECLGGWVLSTLIIRTKATEVHMSLLGPNGLN
jgi:hypothetical protein